MNGLHRPVLRFPQTRPACTGQSQPTFCPGADIHAHNAPACSCCLWRRQPLHSPTAPEQINSVIGVLAARKYTRTEDLGDLVVSTSTAARTPARKPSPVTGTMAAATGFLRTRFVDLER